MFFFKKKVGHPTGLPRTRKFRLCGRVTCRLNFFLPIRLLQKIEKLCFVAQNVVSDDMAVENRRKKGFFEPHRSTSLVNDQSINQSINQAFIMRRGLYVKSVFE